MRDRLTLLLAEGLGAGRLRPAPGTWGSVVGVLWFLVLLIPGNAVFFGAGVVASCAAAVWVCGEAERILGRHDPGSVVLDEIVAMPLCFVPLLLAHARRMGMFPDALGYIRGFAGWTIVLVFIGFRLFDIWKPWPVRQAQRLRGGWGVVADDLLAALWVNIVGILMLAVVG